MYSTRTQKNQRYKMYLWPWQNFNKSCCSVAKFCPTLCNPIDCSTPGFPVLHYLLEFAQTHVCWVSDAIYHLILCGPFSSCHQPFPESGSFPMSQLLASGDQSIGASASLLPMNILGWFPLGLTGLISLLFKGLSRVFYSTTVWKHYFFSTQPSLWSNFHIHTWLLEKPKLWVYRLFLAKWCVCFLICYLGLS